MNDTNVRGRDFLLFDINFVQVMLFTMYLRSSIDCRWPMISDGSAEGSKGEIYSDFTIFVFAVICGNSATGGFTTKSNNVFDFVITLRCFGCGI